MKKIVLVTTGDVLASIACEKLFQGKDKMNFEIVAVVDSNMPFRRAFRIVLNGIKQGALFYVSYMLVEAYGLRIANTLHCCFGLLGLKNNYVKGIFGNAKRRKVPIVKLDNINSSEAIRTIQSYNPDSILCVRPTQILRNKLIASCPRILNLHCTLLPKYRGIGGIFQALSNEEKDLGCTVHVIDSENVDAGPIVAQCKLAADDSSSLLCWTVRLHKEAQDLLLHAIDQKAIVDRVQSGKNQYFSWPNKAELQRFLSTGRRFVTPSDFWALNCSHEVASE